MLRNCIGGLLLFPCLVAPAICQVFVSPNGNDSTPGTMSQPVATLARAVELSRSLQQGQAKRIVLRRGTFSDTSVTITSADSGLIIESDSNEPALLVGGVPLSGWQRDDARFWSAPLPHGRNWDVRMLQVNGRFCPRALLPEQGTLTHRTEFKVPWMSTTGGGWKRKPTVEELTTLEYKEADVPPGLDIRNAEVTVFHMWDESVAGIVTNDVAAHKLKLSPPLGHPPGAFGVQTYCIWNIREGMTRPGQWFFDRRRQRIVYWPLESENMTNLTAVVPTQTAIIRLVDTTNITLRNFSLAVATVPLVTGGFAAAAFDGAVTLEAAPGATLSNLRIFNVAGQAIKGTRHRHSTRVLDCDVSSCGAGGVYLSGADNIVSNTLIHGVGLMFPSAMGIHGEGDGCKLSHNEIYDTTYSAIGFGGKNLVIENNDISDCMKVLHDGAAIYCFAAKQAVLRSNFAHDIVDTGGYGASAYYLDEQSADCVVEDNISVNVVRPSHNHMATNNIIRGNVFMSQKEMRLTFPRCTGYRLEGNVFYAAGTLTFEGVNNVASWSRNLVYSGVGKIEGITLDGYSSTGKVSGLCGDTVVADSNAAVQLESKPPAAARAGRTGRPGGP
jgi:hypothetical protein